MRGTRVNVQQYQRYLAAQLPLVHYEAASAAAERWRWVNGNPVRASVDVMPPLGIKRGAGAGIAGRSKASDNILAGR